MAISPTSWRPGQSGNPHGRPPGRHAIAEALRAKLAESITVDGKTVTKAEAVADVAVNLAIGGDVKSIRFVTEHLEGRPRQQMEVNGCRTVFKALPESILDNIINPGNRLATQAKK